MYYSLWHTNKDDIFKINKLEIQEQLVMQPNPERFDFPF